MAIRQGLRDLFWMSGGVVLLVVITLLAAHNYRAEDTAAKIAFKTHRLELLAGIRTVLFAASEASKNAVMAPTDEDSQIFAEQTRTMSSSVGQRLDELSKLLDSGGTRDEVDSLAQFSRAWSRLQAFDGELLDLAVKNTNFKASALTFGPAAEALTEMDGALARILKASAASASSQAKQVMLRAAGAQSGAWRIQSLLPLHISEESDQRMDELEARMTNEDRTVRTELRELTTLLGSASPDLETARSSYDRFTGLRTQILRLSRENTNVRSLMMSLNQGRLALEACLRPLAALEQAIQSEPVTDRIPVTPR